MSRKRRFQHYQRLLFPLSDRELADELEKRSGLKVRLKVTDNRSSMVRVSRAPDGSARVRAHRIFLQAPRPVLRALASFVRSPRSRPAREALTSYIRAEDDAVSLCGGTAREGDASRNGRPLRSLGEHFDLQQVLDRLNREHFDGAVQAAITWGKPRRSGHAGRPRRTIHFGTFERDAAGGVIRIHPALDRPFVPRCFLELVVFHEMLHEQIPIERDPSGRRIIHSAEFREREARFPHYEAAKRWERNNLHRFARPEVGRVSQPLGAASSRFGLTAH